MELIYVFGFLVTWVLATQYWMTRFPAEYRQGIKQVDFFAPMWGFLVAVLWPLAMVSYVMAYIIGPKK